MTPISQAGPEQLKKIKKKHLKAMKNPNISFQTPKHADETLRLWEKRDQTVTEISLIKDRGFSNGG